MKEFLNSAFNAEAQLLQPSLLLCGFVTIVFKELVPHLELHQLDLLGLLGGEVLKQGIDFQLPVLLSPVELENKVYHLLLVLFDCALVANESVLLGVGNLMKIKDLLTLAIKKVREVKDAERFKE